MSINLFAIYKGEKLLEPTSSKTWQEPYSVAREFGLKSCIL